MAIQLLLKKYKDKQLPRSLSLFFGNVTAAGQNLRRLESQPDYNRIWPGTEFSDCPETKMAKEIVSIMKKRDVFASVDVHNNTGLNPHYACINHLDNQFLQLASLFGRLIVYFIRPKGVQSAAFAQICPAVTLECGRPGQQHGVEHAFEYLNSCLHLLEFPFTVTIFRQCNSSRAKLKKTRKSTGLQSYLAGHRVFRLSRNENGKRNRLHHEKARCFCQCRCT